MISQKSETVERACDESRWEIQLPETVSYIPSKLILTRKSLPGSVIKISSKGRKIT